MPRKTVVVYAGERVAYHRQYREMSETMRESMSLGDNKGADVPMLVWIANAVALGTAEKRPFNQVSIAEHLKLDRRTVARNLGTLVELKVIVRCGDDYFLHPTRIAQVPEAVLTRVARNFHRTTHALSNLIKQFVGATKHPIHTPGQNDHTSD